MTRTFGIKKSLSALHARLGDFWFYSLMLFCALRFGDVLNAFVGLWLVPKYVDPSELGAIMPLTTLALAIALPANAFAMTFSKEVNALATRGRFGQLKSLMRGVFVGTAVFLVLALAVSRLVLPGFLHRIRVAEGTLGLLIVASAFMSTVAPIYSNALQGLKKFTALSAMNVLLAPARLVVMLVAMPLRPLSGYFAGQTATPALQILASVLCLRRELSVKAETYWTRPAVRRFALLFLCVAAYQAASTLAGAVEQTVLRQHLPDVESAAYYMVCRFSDIANFFTLTLATTLFPMTAELAERRQSTLPLVLKSSLAMVALGGAVAAFFWLWGEPIMRLLPNGEGYAPFHWAIPWQIAVNVTVAVQTFYANTEVSAGRFAFLKWWLPLHAAAAAALPLLAPLVTSLSAIMWWFTGVNALRTALCVFALARADRARAAGPAGHPQ